MSSRKIRRKFGSYTLRQSLLLNLTNVARNFFSPGTCNVHFKTAGKLFLQRHVHLILSFAFTFQIYFWIWACIFICVVACTNELNMQIFAIYIFRWLYFNVDGILGWVSGNCYFITKLTDFKLPCFRLKFTSLQAKNACKFS